MKKKLGIIGCGAMGRLIGRHVLEHLSTLYELTAVSSRTSEHASALGKELHVRVLPAERLIEECDMIVEAASASAMPGIVRNCLAARKEVLCLSVGGFALDESLLGEVMGQSTLVHVPSGAVAGLDGISSLREIGLDDLSVTTVKRPESLGLTDLSELPFAEGIGVSPDARLVFDGSAHEAIRRFPANVNIAIALSLAGNGFEKTKVRLIADPQAKGTRHRIMAQAGNCSLEITVAPTPLKENPRSSALAMYSIPALLRQLASPLRLAG
ncbi:aspartate dehydrogenase domain-containing protein [Mailhella sp.]|uniref:aspartate dehydrogenase domain-containing protein n=1 Tax=Mailhella sp. TaxID=1981029 RepID=UPI003AB7DFDF